MPRGALLLFAVPSSVGVSQIAVCCVGLVLSAVSRCFVLLLSAGFS